MKKLRWTIATAVTLLGVGAAVAEDDAATRADELACLEACRNAEDACYVACGESGKNPTDCYEECLDAADECVDACD